MTQSKYWLSVRITARGLSRSDISVKSRRSTSISAAVIVAHVAAPHLAVEDQLAGLGADIGVQHAADKPPQRLDLGDRRIGRQDVAEELHLGRGEPAGPLGRPGERVDQCRPRRPAARSHNG